MIYSLSGVLLEQMHDRAVIECSGVGFAVMMTGLGLAQLPQPGQDVKIYTYMSVKEDSIDLFGFISEAERDCFKLLISVSGVGPKAAISILSVLTPDELAAAIVTGDSAGLTRAQGVGPKAAQRVILELKDKFSSYDISAAKATAPAGRGPAAKSLEVIEALMALGYTQHEAKRAVSSIDISELSTEQVIKQVLKENIK